MIANTSVIVVAAVTTEVSAQVLPNASNTVASTTEPYTSLWQTVVHFILSFF